MNTQSALLEKPSSIEHAGFPRGSIPHILVVDDDVSIRRLNTLVLLRYGYEVHSAQDGSDAWHALSIEHYDLVITDQEMPNLTGIELFARMQAAGMDVPVIFASGSPIPRTYLESSPGAPAALLPKPYTLEDMLATVEQVLRDFYSTKTPVGWDMYPIF